MDGRASEPPAQLPSALPGQGKRNAGTIVEIFMNAIFSLPRIHTAPDAFAYVFLRDPDAAVKHPCA